MSVGVLGRMLTLVGLTCGLLAVALPQVSGESAHYVDDGTTAAFLLVLLALSSWYPAEVGSPALAAGLGAAAFGFFLFLPALLGFDYLGSLDAGAWLGLCTALVPIGVIVAATAEGRAEPGPRLIFDVRDPRTLIGLVGCGLVLGGIWLPMANEGASFWNVSFSGHTLGLLMLLLALLNTVLLALPRLRLMRIVVAGATFGLVAAELILSAFEELGTLGSGAWLEACAGLLLVVATAWPAVGRAAYEAPASLSQSAR